MITIDCGEVSTCGDRAVILDDIHTLVHVLNSSLLKEMQESIKEELEDRGCNATYNTCY